MESMPGSFGPYVLLQCLGEDATGSAWKALDPKLDRTVVLKLVKVGPAHDGNKAQSLIQRAKVASQFHHPHMASIYRAGDVDNSLFIATEYVAGESLQDQLGEIPPDLLFTLGLQACRTLGDAHQKGVVHAELSPGHFLLLPDKQLKILWFPYNPQGHFLSPPTPDGVYLSPEQITHPNTPPTHATDQFLLGLALFHAATGQHPFQRPTAAETRQAICSSPCPNLTTLRKDLPKGFSRVLERMLAKAPADRFPSLQAAEHMFSPLLKLSGGLDINLDLSPVSSPKKRWLYAVLASLLGLIVPLVFFSGMRLHKNRAYKAALRAATRKVVAVLPVELLNISTDMNWTAVSFREAFTMGLLRRSDLTVLDRNRVAEAWEHSYGSLQKLQKELSADYLVTSQLQRTADSLLLTVSLWRQAESLVGKFEVPGDQTHLLEMEDESAQRLPTLFGGMPLMAALPKAQSLRTRELYAKGMENLETGNPEAGRKARQFFESAIQVEPNYAPVHAGLAEALLIVSSRTLLTGKPELKNFNDLAYEEAKKAVELDHGTSLSYRALAATLQRQGRYREAREAGRQAVDLNPGDYRALCILGDAYAMGRSANSREKADHAYLKAIELAPSDWYAHHRLAVSFQNRGALEEAIQRNAIAMELQPYAVFPYVTAAICHTCLGKFAKARDYLEEGLKYEPEMTLIRASLAVVAGLMGEKKVFDYWYKTVENNWPKTHAIPTLLLGIDNLLDGNKEAGRQSFAAFLAHSKSQDWDTAPRIEKRSAAVTIYQMAQFMALIEDNALARQLLEESDRLHAGKWATAQKDPLFTKLKL